MSSYSRALAVAIIACMFVLACRRESVRSGFDAVGRNPAAVISADGERHVVYVDASTRRLVHQRMGERSVQGISPPGDVVDVRGENAPLLVARPDGALLVVYPVLLGGSHHRTIGELHAQLSRDAGRTWSPPRRVDGDDAPRSHNFADLAVARGGSPVVSWLDSRAGKQGVQTAVLRADLTATTAQTVDPQTCQCCKTAIFAASNGEVWLAYRDLAEGNVRNMAYAVSSGAGRPFESRGDVADDHWSINGCPESGPRFAETADGTVWLAWLNGNAAAIEIAAAPHGERFSKRASVATGGVNHPDIGTLPDGRLVVFYEVFRNGKRAVEARISDALHVRWSAAMPVANDGSTPRYVRRGDVALLSYTTYVDGKPHVRVIDPLPRFAPRGLDRSLPLLPRTHSSSPAAAS